MRLPIEWLKEYIDMIGKPEELAEKLTLAGSEVTSIEVNGEKGAVLDIDVLPNRADLLSIMGLAREASAVLAKKMKVPTYHLIENGAGIREKIRVEIKDFDLCPRYMARAVEGVVMGESPDWMKERLLQSGLRPINVIVDVTNYVLLEMGQPLHAFDLNLLEGRSIIVRKAKNKEEIATLDGIKRELTEDMLVIADEKKPVAVAGVMGGGNSEVRVDTTNILLESAYFNPISINKTSRAMKIRTEASVRFERGVDWLGVSAALDRAAYLIAKYAGGKVCKGVIDVKHKDRTPKLVPLRLEKVNSTLGLSLHKSQVVSILASLGFNALKDGSKEAINIEVPTFRAGDIEREIDLIEEIARIHGYDKIKSETPNVPYSPSAADYVEGSLDIIRAQMAASGLTEVQTFSIISPKSSGNFSGANDVELKISNPLSEDVSVMRKMLLPGLLEAISFNTSRQTRDLAIFEVGKTHLPKEKGEFEEKTKLAAAVVGDIYKGNNKVQGGAGFNFYFLKGAIENVLECLGAASSSFVAKGNEILLPGSSAAIFLGREEIGLIGRLREELAGKYDIGTDVYVVEMDLGPLLKGVSSPIRFKQLAKYPKVVRDIAMFVPKDVSHGDIVSAIKDLGAPMLESVHLFDRYSGSQVPEGQVSLAYSLDYRDREKTLTDEQVNEVHEKVMKALEARFGATIRRK